MTHKKIYKQGIYRITNPNGKSYIGQTVNYDRRLKSYYKYRCKSQGKLYNSLKKYGFDSHIFQFIEECNDHELNIRERYWQDFYNVLVDGLNLKLTESDGKSGRYSIESINKMKGPRDSMAGKNNPFYGKTHTEESLKKISIKSRGRTITSQTRKQISNTLSGVKKTKEHCKNISDALKGHAVSDETRKKKSDSMKLWHEDNIHQLQGKSHSIETKKKISESQKLRWKKIKKNEL